MTKSDISSTHSDSDTEEWTQENDYNPIICPCCSTEIRLIPDFLLHMSTAHPSINFATKLETLEFYDYIKLINHLRKNNGTITDSLATDEQLYKPQLPDDSLLSLFDELKLSLNLVKNDENQELFNTKTAYNALMDEFKAYKLAVSQSILNMSEPKKNESSSKKVEEEEGDYYFSSYAHTEIHESMLKDTIRTEAYRDYIYDNKDLFNGKVVLDVGCGTGILSMFAAKAGAKAVYAIDNSSIIHSARKIVKENNLDGVITCIQGKIEEIQLPVEKVDIIISEWMGYFLLFEGMLDSVIWARDKYGGIMVPGKSTISIAAIDDEKWIEDSHYFWDNVYGFRMSCMKSGFFEEGQVGFVNSQTLISDPFLLKEIDMNTTSVPELDFSTPFTIPIKKNTTLTGFVGSFDVLFSDKIKFSTAPTATHTHWKQTAFLLTERPSVLEGWVVEGVFTCVKNQECHRELDVVLTYKVLDGNGMVKIDEKVQRFFVR